MSRRTNPGRHPPSRSSQSPPSNQQQQNTPVYLTQMPPASFGGGPITFPEIQTSNLPQTQTFGNSVQGNASSSSQPLSPQRQAPPLSRSSPSSRNSSTPTRPKPIPLHKLRKAVKLYTEYELAKKLEQQQPTPIYSGGQLNVPAPGSSRSAPTGTGSRAFPASRTNSAYGGTPDPSSIIDFVDNDGNTSPDGRVHEGRSVYNGRTIRQRSRRQLTPAERAKAALIRHLVACSDCHGRSVSCQVEHHDVAAILRERRRLENQGMASTVRRPHSRSQPPLQRPVTTISHASSHDPMRSVSTGQIPEGVGMTNLFIGLGENDHFLHTTSPTSASDPQSPSHFPDLLTGIQARETGQLPFGAPNSLELTRLGLQINAPVTGYRDGALFVIGVQRPQGFACAFNSSEGECLQFSEDPEMLQIHFELQHFPFTRIDPAHRYVCGNCGNFSNLPVNLCLACRRELTCETRIYGRYINTSLDEPFTTDDQGPFPPFSPNTHDFLGSGFDFQNNQSMNHGNGMGSGDNGNMNQGGGFSYDSNNQFQSSNTHGGSNGNSNSSRNSQAGDFQFQANQFSINAVVEGSFDYFHAKGRQKLHRHRLLAITLIISALFIFQAYSWIITKAQTATDMSCVGFGSMLVSFVGSYAYWTIKDSLSLKNESVSYSYHSASSIYLLIILSLSALLLPISQLCRSAVTIRPENAILNPRYLCVSLTTHNETMKLRINENTT